MSNVCVVPVYFKHARDVSVCAVSY